MIRWDLGSKANHLKIIQNVESKEGLWSLHRCREEARACQLDRFGNGIGTMTELEVILVDSVSMNDSYFARFGVRRMVGTPSDVMS